MSTNETKSSRRLSWELALASILLLLLLISSL